MEKKRFYLEEQTGAAFYRDAESNTYTLTFQTAEIKLSNSLEAELLKQQDPLLERTIAEAEDELVITVHPQETMQPFSKFRKKAITPNKSLATHLFARLPSITVPGCI